MRIIKHHTLQLFWSDKKYKKAEQSLKSWIREIKAGDWSSSAELKAQYKNASIINHERVVFNICGNSYRLIVAIRYDLKIVYVKYFGTHDEYDGVDASTVQRYEP